MKTKITKIFAFSTSFLVLGLPLLVIAQATPDAVIYNPIKAGSDVSVIIDTVLSYIIKIGGVAATLAFIYSGFLFVKAQGNETELKTAKTVFTNTCIGVAVLLGAKLLASIIVTTLNGLSGK